MAPDAFGSRRSGAAASCKRTLGRSYFLDFTAAAASEATVASSRAWRVQSIGVRRSRAAARSMAVRRDCGMRSVNRASRFLDQRDREHPLLPGAIERVVGRCPGLRNEVVAQLADVRECLDHALLRPAIALLGVAYEVLVETIFDSLVDRRIVATNVDARAARRIELIRISLDTALPGNTAEVRDERSAARNTLDFADQLRRRRNQASHTRPTWGFEDRSEVEDMFVLPIGGLPALGRLHAPAAP